MTLRLVSLPDDDKGFLRGAYRAKQAAFYMNMSINKFRKLRIPARLSGKLRVWLRRDLDAVLESLPRAGPRTNMAPRSSVRRSERKEDL